MKNKTAQIIKEVDATMSLEGESLSELDKELYAKIIEDELTREEAFEIFKKRIGYEDKVKGPSK